MFWIKNKKVDIIIIKVLISYINQEELEKKINNRIKI